MADEDLVKQDLRLDYSVECEECGQVHDIPRSLSEAQAQQVLRDEGWRLIDNANTCPACVRRRDRGN